MISIGKRGPISMLKEGIEPDFNYEYSAIIDLDDNILFSLDENKLDFIIDAYSRVEAEQIYNIKTPENVVDFL